MSAQTPRENLTTQRFTFPRDARILRPSDYKQVFQNGSKAADRQFVCHVSRQEKGAGSKVGLAVSRKVGKAVVRNRVKRRVREFFRTRRRDFRHDVWVVCVARPEAAQLSARETNEVLERLLKTRGVL